MQGTEPGNMDQKIKMIQFLFSRILLANGREKQETKTCNRFMIVTLLGMSTQCCGCRENIYLITKRRLKYKLNLNGPGGDRQSDKKVAQKVDTAYSNTRR